MMYIVLCVCPQVKGISSLSLKARVTRNLRQVSWIARQRFQ